MSLRANFLISFDIIESSCVAGEQGFEDIGHSLVVERDLEKLGGSYGSRRNGVIWYWASGRFEESSFLLGMNRSETI